MMLWIANRGPDAESDPDLHGFHYYLAHQLGMSVSEVRAMGHRELIGWGAYFTARAAVADMGPPT